ncbi:DEAD/DEAH box helicase domain-containing protein [Bombiscardovia coagulans]|uniref:DEAD/DEAH box helicase domain-containing protein n=2 Tax=Bombiscardovia coagulans TaxID=686666 RepID=A0A261EUV3_9BIFI|nr:DEAD/DEAH box helicase domain-containing protein [Bombiscardovia coagulans]
MLSTITIPSVGKVRSQTHHSVANFDNADTDQMNTLTVNKMSETAIQQSADSSETNGHQDHDKPKTFAQLGVPDSLVRVLKSKGMTTAFPIQEDTLPDSLAGRDILGRGRTGSGKTLAFVLPLVARLAESAHNHRDTRNARDRRSLPAPRGLILSPTRELANQIDEVLSPLVHAVGLNTCTIYGGVRQNRQVNALRSGAQIVVACPGRLEDLLQQHLLTLDDVEITVLDEADEMSDMGFLPAVERILGQVRDDGQRMLFSATLDHGVDAVVRRFLHDAKVHEVDSATQHVDQMTHHIFETTQADKHDLVRKLASGKGKRILFTRTKFQAKKLAAHLTNNGIPAAELHGNLSQNQRDRNLAAFSSGQVRVLVATDVAARGVDVSGVDLVVQVDPPADPKSFLHRSGRTARAGKAGDVVTIVLPNQRRDTRRMLKIAHIDAKPNYQVTADSEIVEELVGEAAPRVDGWTLESLRPAKTPGSGRRSGGSRGGRGGHRDDRKGGRRPYRSHDSRDTRYSQGFSDESSRRSDKRNRNRSKGYKHQDDSQQDGPIDARGGRDRGYKRHAEGGQGKFRTGRQEERGEKRRGTSSTRSGAPRGIQHRTNRSKRSSNPFRGR